MLSVEQFRQRGLMASFGISAIRLYQNTYSQITPRRCRFTPSCSSYGIEAIENYGLIEGIGLTRSRISRCHRPNGGYDPVPKTNVYLAKKKKIDREAVKQAGFKMIEDFAPKEVVLNYQHRFRLILAYPKNREFLSQSDFQSKIANISKYVFKNPNFALQYKIAKIEIGIIDDYYLIRLSGSISSDYRETEIEQVIDLIIIQLAAFFLVTQEQEFQAIYFEVDGQILIQPQPKTKAIPKSYKGRDNFWNYTSDPDIWDLYWGDFAVDLVFYLGDSLADNLFDLDGIDSNSDGCDTFDGCNDSNSDGCDAFDGCSDNNSDGCEGCEGGGCDGCDGLDGCS